MNKRHNCSQGRIETITEELRRDEATSFIISHPQDHSLIPSSAAVRDNCCAYSASQNSKQSYRESRRGSLKKLGCTMKAARWALFVLALYAVSTHRFVNGMGPMAVLGLVESGIDLVDRIKGLDEEDKFEGLMTRISDVSQRIQSFELNSMYQNQLNFAKLPGLIQAQTLLSNHLQDLNKQLDKISRKYSLLKEYADGTTTYENYTINDFAASCVSATDGVQETLGKLHSLIIANKDGFKNHDVIRLLADYLRGIISTQCNDKQSHQTMLYDLYTHIAVAEIKGLALMQFSYMVLKLHGRGNFTRELQLTQNTYQTRLNETLDAFRTAMSIASPDVWRCDPPEWDNLGGWMGGSDYVELKFVHSFMVDEEKLHWKRNCRGTCSDHRDAVEYRDRADAFFPTKPRCFGTLHDCYGQEKPLKVCLNPNARWGGPVYDWIEYPKSGRVLGNKTDCKMPVREIESLGIFEYLKPDRCEYCVCTCVEERHIFSQRFISVMESVSDVKANKVITGMDFTQINRVIHLRVEQGDLLPDGKVTNLERMELDEFEPTARSSVRWDSNNVELNKAYIEEPSTEGDKWATLTWRERAIDLDDVVSPPGHCLTGVRLRKKNSHLRLEIRSTPFDFATGKLIDPETKSFWHGNEDTSPKTRLELKNPDRSSRTNFPSIPNFGSNQYIEFGPSDLDKDVGQSTVPFFDIQTVLPSPRVVLAGAGLYHKGRDGFGGFIAPKVKTYNIGPHLHTDL